MIKFLISWLKPALSAGILVFILYSTGLLSDVSAFAQRAVLQTGLLNATAPTAKPKTDFDFGFTVKDLKGNKVSFEQYKGKVVFLNLWATWCGPCKAEMPGIQSLHDKLKDSNVAFVMLSIDRDQDLPKIEKYVEKNNFTFPVFQPAGYLTDQLNVPSIPTTFVISKAGKIVMKEVGTRNYDTKKILDFLTAEAAK
ncbi:MAG: redoxin domain-containing protein [Cytophagales bacterium]|nr:redoxin domain-containing protein [Cytophagales bacterium]